MLVDIVIYRQLRRLNSVLVVTPQARLRLTWGYYSVRQLRWLGEWFDAGKL